MCRSVSIYMFKYIQVCVYLYKCSIYALECKSLCMCTSVSLMRLSVKVCVYVHKCVPVYA